MFVPVVNSENRPLMPTTNARAKRWIRSGKATPFWKKGVFCVRRVDSWVLANWCTGGHIQPDNTKLIEVIPLEFHRRQLHRLQHSTGHVRSRYGGTISAGLKRGSIVKHPLIWVLLRWRLARVTNQERPMSKNN